MWGRGGSALDLLLQVALEASMSRVQARLGQTGPWGLGGLGRPQLRGSTREPREGGDMGRARAWDGARRGWIVKARHRARGARREESPGGRCPKPSGTNVSRRSSHCVRCCWGVQTEECKAGPRIWQQGGQRRPLPPCGGVRGQKLSRGVLQGECQKVKEDE